MRHPSTPDCAIKGCTYAARRFGMCERHAQLAPRFFGIETALVSASAASVASRKMWRKAQAHVRKEIAAGRVTPAA